MALFFHTLSWSIASGDWLACQPIKEPSEEAVSVWRRVSRIMQSHSRGEESAGNAGYSTRAAEHLRKWALNGGACTVSTRCPWLPRDSEISYWVRI